MRARVALIVITSLAALGVPLALGPASAAAEPGPCRGCGGYSDGTQTVYGGSFHVRVKPPAVPVDGGGGGGGATGAVADCSGLMAPYQFPAQDLPVPCNDPRLSWIYNPLPGPCAGPAFYYQERWFFQSATSTWFNGRVARNVCLTAQDFIDAGVAPPPGLMAVSIWRAMPFPDPQLAVKPAVKGLANLESYFWVDGPSTQVRSVNVGPYTVAVTGRVVDYQWSWGDGTPSLSTSDPGVPWPRRSDVSHAYRRAGQFPVTVTSHWHGTFTVDGNVPQDVFGPDILRSATISYAVQEIRVTLTQ